MPRRTILLFAALLTAAAATPSSAQAANACRAHADHAKVLAQSKTMLVYRTGPRFRRYVRACTFSSPRRSYRLPGQDGDNANHLETYRIHGPYLAYVMFNQEEASPSVTSFVYSVNVPKRRKLVERQSGGRGSDEVTTTEVRSLVVGAKGAIAWINDSINLAQKLSVRAAAPRRRTVVLDRGNGIGRRSLALAANNRTVYWREGSRTKAAPLPTPGPRGG